MLRSMMLLDQKAEIRWYRKRITFPNDAGKPKRMRFGSLLAVVRRLHE